MASQTTSGIHKLILDNLPASGGMPLRDFTASLPEVDRRAAQGQIQTLKLSGKVATWLVTDEAGNTVTHIGLAASKPPKA